MSMAAISQLEQSNQENASRPLVSVVIPFYNRVDWLTEAVNSVMAQTYSHYEIIVVNDGSKEDVSSFLGQYGTKINYFWQENAGPGAARNKGIAHANGKYIAFLDSDDLWISNKLEAQVDYMEKHPELTWSHCAYQTFDQNGVQKIINTQRSKGMLFPQCFTSLTLATPCVIIRKNIFDENASFRFNEKMRYGQDFYLWVLLCSAYPLGVIDEVLCQVRMRGGNAAKRAYVMLKAKSELWNNLQAVDVPLKSVPKRVETAYQCCRRGFRVVNAANKRIKNQKTLELISKALYVLPYLLLKIQKKRDQKLQ